MEVSYIETSRVKLSTAIRYKWVTEVWGPPGREWTFSRKVRLHSPKERITGKYYVNGEYITDWVQYK